MTVRKQFKEIYIRLVEDEAALICTLRYGGVFRIPTRLSLEGTAEALPKDQPVQLSREERGLRATDQGGS